MNGVCLYYPRIAIPSDAWLKSTLLLWDSVRRIMPQYAGVQDDAEIERFVGADLVQATSPFDYTHRAEEIFFEKLRMPDEAGRTLEDSLLRGVGSPDPEVLDQSERIHVEKVSGPLVHRLGDMGLVRRADGGWLQFDSRVGALYMTCLATAMASAMGAPLVTDESPYLGWAHLFAVPPRGSNSDTLVACLAALNIEWPDSAALASVTTDCFIRFHEERSSERRAFRDELLRLVGDLSHVQDPHQLADALAARRREVQARLDDLKKAQQELGVQSFVGALSLGCPTLITAGLAAGMVGPSAAAVGGAIGVGLSLASWAADTRGRMRDFRRSDPLYYVHALQRLA